jgi:uncharacterized tellurite resistance protein B-like protein
MDKFRAAFEILYFLSFADENVDERELSVITKFLDTNYGSIDFDSTEIINKINSLTKEKRIDEFKSALVAFNKEAGTEEKIILLEFAFDVVFADGELQDSELGMFEIIDEIWGIDLKSFLERRGLI